MGIGHLQLICWVAALHLVLTAGLGLAIRRFAVEQGVCVFLVGSGLLAWLAFGVHFASPAAGLLFDAVAGVALVAGAGRLLALGQGDALRSAHCWVLPATSYALLVLLLGLPSPDDTRGLAFQAA